LVDHGGFFLYYPFPNRTGSILDFDWLHDPVLPVWQPEFPSNLLKKRLKAGTGQNKTPKCLKNILKKKSQIGF